MKTKKDVEEIDLMRAAKKREECDYCGGEGVITGDADDGEGHLMRGAGDEETCICQLEN